MNARAPTAIAIALVAIPSPRTLADNYEAYYLYLGGYPIAETLWSNDVQGVAHDDENWFITNTELIFKIPVQHNLRTVSLASPGVLLRDLREYPQLAGYHHTGDPVVYRYNGVDYLLVPIEGPGVPGAVAALNCDTLAYIDHASLLQIGDAGWCAVDPDGLLYSSYQHTHGIFRYNVDWARLQSENTLAITYIGSSAMYNEQGQFLDLTTMQGGEFSSGGLLYISSGFYDDSDGLEEREGIHVLQKFTESNGNPGWRRIQHSTRGYGYFDYYYNPGFPTYEEPEGLTLWDLDDGRAPGIRGQLHVLVSDNDHEAGDVDFKHYTSVLRVNPFTGCAPGLPTGGPTCPFTTIAAAASFAWNGAELRIQSTTYTGPLTIAKRLRLTAENGVVRIGH